MSRSGGLRCAGPTMWTAGEQPPGPVGACRDATGLGAWVEGRQAPREVGAEWGRSKTRTRHPRGAPRQEWGSLVQDRLHLPQGELLPGPRLGPGALQALVACLMSLPVSGATMATGRKPSGPRWMTATTRISAARTASTTSTTETGAATPTTPWTGEPAWARGRVGGRALHSNPPRLVSLKSPLLGEKVRGR